MTMLVAGYRFHCTDGQDAVIDRSVWRIRNPDLVWQHAERIARKVMENCSDLSDWVGWIVDVHDANGRRVGVLGFDEIRVVRRAA